MDKDRIAGSAKDFAGKWKARSATWLAMPGPRPRAAPARPLLRAEPLRPGQGYPRATPLTPAVGYARDAYDNSGETFRDGSQAGGEEGAGQSASARS